MMNWYKRYKADMPKDFKQICEDYTKKYSPEPAYRYKSVEDSSMWTIPPLGENRVRLDVPESTQINHVIKYVSNVTELNLEHDMPFTCIWRFDDNFKKCPVHVDNGGEHTGSVVTCISGKFKLHLHEQEDNDSDIIETIDIDETTLIALNNTKFPHSVEGKGDLVVFGPDKKIKPEEYFADE
jgi:hypothetical protein|tara:strand:- start:288 stop:833 length:546 start_codon:yes stop_codon:yes gene_type:complete